MVQLCFPARNVHSPPQATGKSRRLFFSPGIFSLDFKREFKRCCCYFKAELRQQEVTSQLFGNHPHNAGAPGRHHAAGGATTNTSSVRGGSPASLRGLSPAPRRPSPAAAAPTAPQQHPRPNISYTPLHQRPAQPAADSPPHNGECLNSPQHSHNRRFYGSAIELKERCARTKNLSYL